MANELRTQKTEVFFLDTTIKKILNVADIGEFGPQADDIDVTNLDSDAKEFLTGLGDNGELTLQINLNASDPVHQKLSDEAGKGTRFAFCVALSDGTAPPTATAGPPPVLTPPAASARTSFVFLASVKSFRNAVKTNDAVRVNCTLRISGGITKTWKTP